jgi:hypothetical protein
VRLVLKELLDGVGETPDQVGEVLVIAINENNLPEDGIVVTEEVDEADDHWANRFSTRPYTLAEIKRLILDDQARRRQRHMERAAAAEVLQ